jgi:DHA1 family bicyclomycin/chloramphenicol resistance-like MFS transporter
LKRTDGVLFVVTLGSMLAVTATAVDISIPAHAIVARDFGRPVADGASIVPAFMAGFGLGQFLWGPVSDRFGRLPPLFASLAGFVAASIVCALTESFAVLLAARFVQGVMGGAGQTIGRAIARDLGGGQRTATVLSGAMVVLGAAPLLAPILGSAILVVAEWRAIFWFLAAFGALIALAAALRIPETLPPERRAVPSLRRMGGDFAALARMPAFVMGAATAASIFVGYLALIAMGSVVAEHVYDVPATQFGWLFAIITGGFSVGAAGAGWQVRRAGLGTAVRTGALLGAAAGIAVLAMSLAEKPPLAPLWAGFTLYVTSFGWLMGLCAAWALEPAGRIAGTASAVLGAAQTLAGAASAVLTAALFDGSHRALCWVVGAAGLLTLALWVKGRRWL